MPFLIFFDKLHIYLINWAFRKKSKDWNNCAQLKIISKRFNLFLVSQIKRSRKKSFYRQLRISWLHKIKIFREPSLCRNSSVIREMIVPLTEFYLDINVSHIKFDMCLPTFLLLRRFPAQTGACSFIKRLTREIITNNGIAFLLLL